MHILPTKEVCRRIGVSRTKLWQMTKEGRFVRPVIVDGARKGYIDSEVDERILQRIAARDQEVA